jgi:hypothetical protein
LKYPSFDVASIRRFNLYVELLVLNAPSDPTLGDPPPDLYASSCRLVRRGARTILEAWSYPLDIGQPLPTLLLHLSEDRVIPLELDRSDEQAFHDLWFADDYSLENLLGQPSGLSQMAAEPEP